MECPRTEHLVDVLIRASQQYAPILDTYCKLAMSNELSDEEVDLLATIYTDAETDRLLNFFINEFDYILGRRLGLLTNEFVENYKNQQAWLREHLEEIPLDQVYRVKIQSLLRDQGFYNGPIDGVLGHRSIAAVQEFQRSHQLKDDGVPGKQTFSALQYG